MAVLNFGPGARGNKQEDEKLCPFAGCDNLIPVKTRGCAEHKNLLSAADAERRRNHPRNLVYKDSRWKLCRHIVLERDNWTCVDCGHFDETGRTLSCDHANEGGVMACPDPFDPAYCETRCRVCSGRKDGARGTREAHYRATGKVKEVR